MSSKKLSKEIFESFIDSVISEQKVIGVQAKGAKFDFDVLESAKDLRLDYDVTLGPPKKCFQPPQETLMTFEIGGEYESEHDSEAFVLVGVHPYDMIAINQMDAIFAQDNRDSHYFARRDNATIIVCDVVTASENVFASSMGTATVESGYDIILTKIGEDIIAEADTEKGEFLLAKAQGSVEASEKDLKERDKIREKNRESLNKHKLECEPGDLPELLENAYDHPVWEEKAKTCFACGSCNIVCPTCYCFNVKDDVNWDMQSGQRCRSWDGCVLAGFTKVAGDHEFRAKKADRIRHRIYRKGKYVPAKIQGQIACVGCGRCVKACLPDIANPVNIYNRLLEDIKV